jgi:hypothetical protein
MRQGKFSRRLRWRAHFPSLKRAFNTRIEKPHHNNVCLKTAAKTALIFPA